MRLPSRTRSAPAAIFTLATACLVSCRFTPTEVLVTLGTDAPGDRELSIRVFLFRGDAGHEVAPSHVFTRGGPNSDTMLPASFGVVPDGEPRDQSVLLRIEAQLAAGGGAPAQTFRRSARFAFTPRVIGSLPIYLAVSCGNPATGCTTVAPAACTVSVRCEEMNATCGNRGECVAVDTMPIPVAAPSADASVDFGVVPPVDAADEGIDASNDASDASDAPDADVTDAPLAPPRLISPLSGSHVTSATGTVRFALGPGTDDVYLQFCNEPECRMPAIAGFTPGPTAPIPNLAPGVWFWRARSRRGTFVDDSTTTRSWQFRIPHRNASLDAHSANDFDADGDGIDDMVVGAPHAGGGAGAVHYYRGGATAFTTPTRTLSLTASLGFGTSVANAGDVNGDGCSDLLVGAPGSNGGIGSAALVLGVYGVGIDATGTPLVAGVETGFGSVVGGLGDVNGDGYGDLAIVSNGAASEGAVYVYHGTATGLGTAPAIVLRGADGATTGLGASIAQHIDVNADGYADLVVGAPGARITPCLYVYFGSASGLPATPSQRIDSPDGANTQFASAMANAGDVDGDGYPDVVVGAFGYNTSTGRAYLFGGSSTGLVSTPRAVIDGPDGTNGFFASAISGASDIDHDGFDDVVVSTPNARSNTGRVHVYAGAMATPLTREIVSIDGPDGLTGYFGWDVSLVGDVDGNGTGDLLVGAPYAPGGSMAGRVHLFRASGGMVSTTSEPIDSPSGASGFFGAAVR